MPLLEGKFFAILFGMGNTPNAFNAYSTGTTTKGTTTLLLQSTAKSRIGSTIGTCTVLVGSFCRRRQDSQHRQLTDSLLFEHHSSSPSFSGMALCTVIMTPPPEQPIRAVVCFCHGYTDNVSYSKQIEYQRLVEHGIAFVGIEYEGHGRSDGMLGLISDWDQLVHDAATYFQETLQTQKRFQNVPAFLMGESMGYVLKQWSLPHLSHVVGRTVLSHKSLCLFVCLNLHGFAVARWHTPCISAPHHPQHLPMLPPNCFKAWFLCVPCAKYPMTCCHRNGS